MLTAASPSGSVVVTLSMAAAVSENVNDFSSAIGYFTVALVVVMVMSLASNVTTGRSEKSYTTSPPDVVCTCKATPAMETILDVSIMHNTKRFFFIGNIVMLVNNYVEKRVQIYIFFLIICIYNEKMITFAEIFYLKKTNDIIMLYRIYLFCILRVMCMLLAMLLPTALFAEHTKEEKIDRLSPDFVVASVIVAEPYDILYSCYGHTALRLQCPTYGLDYVFTCEGESVQDNIARFFMGKLQMEVYSFKTDAFIENYKQQHRGCMEYVLNLPPEAKQRLWQQMDERAKEEPVQYDFINNGCTHLVLSWIEQALYGHTIEHKKWPDSFRMTRKRIAGDACKEFPWNHFVIGSMVDGVLNDDCEMWEKVIIPRDLVEVLRHTIVDGQTAIASEHTLVESGQKDSEQTLFTPMFVAILLLCVSVLLLVLCMSVNTDAVRRVADMWRYAMLALQTTAALFIVYLVCCTSLPGTEYNWLLVPFNPLPLLLWHWRRRWCKQWLIINVLWCIAIVACPFICEDLAYIPLTMALAIAML